VYCIIYYQAAASPHGIEDVGTNIVFHGVHNEGGVHGARKFQTRKGIVGSYNVNPVCKNCGQRC
jgi:hypothetical protein